MPFSTDARQLLADQHVDDAPSAEHGAQYHPAGCSGDDPADHRRTRAEPVAMQHSQRGVGLALRNNCDQLALMAR